MSKRKSLLTLQNPLWLTEKRQKLILSFLFFISMWLFFWILYGDVLFQLQEQSLWIFASPAEFELLILPSDILTYISRFILTFFAVKWFGAFVLALLLTLCEILTGYIFNFCRYYFVRFVPSAVLATIASTHSYEMYYETENSLFIQILLITLAILALVALTVRIFRGAKTVSFCTYRMFLTNVVVILAFFAALSIYALHDSEFIRIASLKYLIENNRWSDAARLAEKSKNPTKPVAAYHAIAIAHMGQIGDRLFRISHDFKAQPAQSSNLRKKFLDGGLLYAPYIYLYSGFLQPAYRYAMEELVMCGTYKCYLKVMIQTAVIRRETKLADKLLSVLAKAPFEEKFVKLYRDYNHHPEKMKSDWNIAAIRELIPSDDTFEQVYKEPLYINYYNDLSGGSDRALDLSLVSSLYMKDLQSFSSRVGALIQRNIVPRYFQEALVMMCQISNPEVLSQFKISPQVYSDVTEFYNQLDRYARTPDKGKKAMKDRFGKTYMYYSYFENISKK